MLISKNKLRNIITNMVLKEYAGPGGPTGGVFGPEGPAGAAKALFKGEGPNTYVADATAPSQGVYSIAEQVPDGVNVTLRLTNGLNYEEEFNITEFASPNRPIICIDCGENDNKWADFLDKLADGLDFPVYAESLKDTYQAYKFFGGSRDAYEQAYSEDLWEKIKDVVGAGQPDYSNQLPLIIKTGDKFYNAVDYLTYAYFVYEDDPIYDDVEGAKGTDEKKRQRIRLLELFNDLGVKKGAGATKPTAMSILPLTGRIQRESRNRTKNLLLERTVGADAGEVFFNDRQKNQEGTSTAITDPVSAIATKKDPGPFAFVIYGPANTFGIGTNKTYREPISSSDATGIRQEVATQFAFYVKKELASNAALFDDNFGVWLASPAGFYNLFINDDIKPQLVRAFANLGIQYSDEEAADEDPKEPEETKYRCPEDPAKIKANFKANTTGKIEQIERGINKYLDWHDLTGTISADGNWESETDTAFGKVAKHAIAGHPIFKEFGLSAGDANQIGSDWKGSASKLGRPGYSGNLTGMLAFVADAFNCDDEYSKKKRGAAGGKKPAAKEKEEEETSKPDAPKLEPRKASDIVVKFQGKLRNRDDLDDLKRQLQDLTVNNLYSDKVKETGKININTGVGGKPQIRASKNINKVMVNAVRKMITGVKNTRGTIIISVPAGDYSNALQEAVQLVSLLRSLINTN